MEAVKGGEPGAAATTLEAGSAYKGGERRRDAAVSAARGARGRSLAVVGGVGRGEGPRSSRDQEPSRPRRESWIWTKLYRGINVILPQSWYSRPVLESHFLWDGGSIHHPNIPHKKCAYVTVMLLGVLSCCSAPLLAFHN